MNYTDLFDLNNDQAYYYLIHFYKRNQIYKRRNVLDNHIPTCVEIFSDITLCFSKSGQN